MTASDLQSRTLLRLGDTPGAATSFYTPTEVLNWLNAAQRLMVLLTLCLEKSVTMNLTAFEAYYNMLGIFPDWILPLRIRLNSGTKLSPGRLSDFAALDSEWNISYGVPTRYALLGFDFLGIYQQPTGSTPSTLTYACSPTGLFLATDVPQVPTEYHPALIDGAIPLLRAKEGGQEWQKVLPLWDRFLDACTKLGDYVRARNKEQGYDRMPTEIRRFDRSKLLMEVAGAKQ